ncbi:LCP family protein [Planomicrobium sp. CPCC 101110]|uniref:LCP family glycopolymer transferase n=1 Tax=Planomicrobium sp. CPCC 101110 TaxID=2599619 RepID=UPI0011B6B194|nr:LCP family protein [Planomicrobium sp. CPCC 101110]TWT27887.1 LytR family transcriptional regulator [Planomicrobium sp. CPCC 101110]
MEKRKARSPKKKLLRGTGWAIAFIFAVAGAYLFFLIPDATITLDEIYEPIAREVSAKRPEKVVLEKQAPISVLLLGVDEREDDRGRSDTMIVLTINPTDKSTKMVSIPRDTYTEIKGYGIFDKINHAYAFGGMMMSMESVENLLDIPIDYAIQVNMEGFEDIVDAVGGITIESPLAFEDFTLGEQTIDGEQALRYVKMRKQDPNGDFGRQDRQKQVIESILNKTASAKSLYNYKKIFDALGENIKTSFSFSELMEIQKNYRGAIQSIDQIYFEKGTDLTIDNIWYYQMNPQELKYVQQTLKEHLEIK